MIAKCLLIEKRIMLLLSLKRRRNDTTLQSQLYVQEMKKWVTAVLLTIRSMNVSFRKWLILQLRLPLWAAVKTKAIIWQISLDKMRSFGFIRVAVLHNSYCFMTIPIVFSLNQFLITEAPGGVMVRATELTNRVRKLTELVSTHFALIPSTKVELNSCTLP